MKKNRKVVRISVDDAQPATKGDVRLAQDELAITTANGFTSVETRLTGVEGRLTGVETRLTGVETRLTGVEGRLKHIEKTMATKDDLKNFATKEDLNKLNERVEDLGHTIDRVDRTQKTILEILDENTQILKEIRHLPARVDRLEKAVFRR